MSEDFIPSDEGVRNGYATNILDEYSDPIGAASNRRFFEQAFDRWMDAHDEEIAKQTRHKIASLIWEEEHVAGSILYETDLPIADPRVIHLNGRVLGLQRARDIAEMGTRRVDEVG